MYIKSKGLLKGLLWILQGIIVGFGAIMPGISGGTLCVAFGMYLPIIEIMSKPGKNIKKYGKMLVLFGLGGAIGFVGLSGFAGWLLEKSSVYVTCAFIGFIIGTFPQLWREAGQKGRTDNACIALAIGFTVMFCLLLFMQNNNLMTIRADWIGFILCGILWGLSFIVPGLSSSTLLLFFGIYQSMLEGIARLDMTVIIPIAVGVIACVSLLSKGVDWIYKKHYSLVSHFIIGIVAATTVMILPSWSFKISSILCRLLFIVGGAVISYVFTIMCDKIKQKN